MPLARDGRVGDSNNSFVFIAPNVVRMHFITIMSAPLRLTVNCYILISRREIETMMQRVFSAFNFVFFNWLIFYLLALYSVRKKYFQRAYARAHVFSIPTA